MSRVEPNLSVVPNLVRNGSRLIDDVLRGRVENWRAANKRFVLLRILLVIATCGSLYGATMGSYAPSWGETRVLQMCYSALKVPFLLLVTFLISLPSFYVANSMIGLHADFGRALRALITTQAALTIVLAGVAPFTMLVYASGCSYDQALAFNAGMFGLASVSVQVLLRRLYRPLIQRDPRHRWMVFAWIVIYSFVGIQMGWVLRPFIGSLHQATTFFREGAWGNAYLVVLELISRLL